MQEHEMIKEYFALSDIGNKRKNNEDVFASLIDYGFFALADGMGGHKAGEVAAKEAISFICSSIKQVLLQTKPEITLDQLSQHVKNLFENANNWIYRLSKTDESLMGMGTTLCSVLFLQEKLLFSHVGDSRVYCFRENELYLMTKDHSAFVRSKQKQLRLKKILTQVIGTPKTIEPEIGFHEIKKNDLFLVCSDGLTDFVKKEYIRLILSSNGTLEKKAKLLIETAKKQGSTDNITVLLIKT
jgi:protein phosphatase